MCRLLRSCLVAAAALPLFALAPAVQADDALPAAVRAALADAGVPPEAFAAAALPLAHDARPWRWQAERPMQPASSLKALTSIVALDRLGPNHRGYTELRSTGAVNGALLQGDLVLRGGADPELGVPQFWAMLAELRAQGVREIAGDLVVDRTLLRPARTDLGLPPFDETPEFAYNVIPDALQLAGALLRIDIDSAGGTLRAFTVPALPGVTVTSRMTLTERRCRDWDDDWQPARLERRGDALAIELRGGFPRGDATREATAVATAGTAAGTAAGAAGAAGDAPGCSVHAELQLIDRQELTERLFRALWSELGGRFAGRVREGAAPPGTRLLVRRVARPWGEVLRHMNKRSDNAQARLLYLSLGLAAMAAEPEASTAELAARAVRGWLAEHDIDAAGLVLDNGSGLSRSERIAPLTLARALAVAWHGPRASDLAMSLPVVGEETALALRASPAAGWARMKSGTLRDVVALAGYARDRAGRPWVLAMMINHPNAARARGALFAMVDELARRGLPEPAAAVGPQGDGP
ncbi:MAG: D-alanyl-D-alanine carboxypeptidase [Rubrivivax sp.]